MIRSTEGWLPPWTSCDSASGLLPGSHYGKYLWAVGMLFVEAETLRSSSGVGVRNERRCRGRVEEKGTREGKERARKRDIIIIIDFSIKQVICG